LNLDQSQQSVYDAVFVNPPYGRLLGLDHPVPADWSGVSAPGHINKCALFIGLALRLVKPGGLVAAVCPSGTASSASVPLSSTASYKICTMRRSYSAASLASRQV
jgi:hypothetical protein